MDTVAEDRRLTLKFRELVIKKDEIRRTRNRLIEEDRPAWMIITLTERLTAVQLELDETKRTFYRFRKANEGKWMWGGEETETK